MSEQKPSGRMENKGDKAGGRALGGPNPRFLEPRVSSSPHLDSSKAGVSLAEQGACWLGLWPPTQLHLSPTRGLNI